MIREDRELLTELARVNRDMASLGMRITEGSASSAEQAHYAQRLIAVGERLHRRAQVVDRTVVYGEILDEKMLALLGNTLEPQQRLQSAPERGT